MNEELMTNQTEEIENTEVEAVVNEEPETSGNGIIKLAIGLIGAGVAAALVWHNTKGKREESRVKRAEKRRAKMIAELEKDGYVVYPCPDDDDYDEDVENAEVNNETK